MDCSTFSNRTGVDDTTVNDESAGALRRQLEAAGRSMEATQQELHEARRNYQTALDVQHHLAAELEAQRTGEERRAAELRARINTLQDDMQTLRAERSTSADAHTQETEALQSQIRDLKERLSFKAAEEQVTQEKTSSEGNEELINLKNDHNSLLSCMNEQKRVLEENMAVIASLKERLSELGEELSCSRSVLDTKKEELQSATEALHSAQSELTLANIELQRMKNEGNSHAAKGNSLFAEVEDSRQQMVKALSTVRQQNLQLKRELKNKQGELDGLLYEKRTLWEEYSNLSGVLDAEMIKSYEQRITDLSRTVEHQRREQARWFSKYYEPGGSQAAEWVAGVLAHLKNRCGQLTDDLLETSVDNLSKASQIRELHKKVASLTLRGLEAERMNSIGTVEVEEPPLDLKHDVKTETHAHEEPNGIDKKYVKREKTANDVKKKVTF